MRSEQRRPKQDTELDERIAKLVVRILAKAVLDAHGRDHIAWESFRQH
jgi:hypothetical protein